MTTTINGRTPEEIKKGLNHCSEDGCKQCPYKDDCDMADGFSVLAGDANAYIQQLEEQVPKWISVEERLPEKDGKCIVCTAKGSVYCTRFKAYGKSGSFQTDINTHITHWMLLPSMPEPLKEDCNEQ